MLAINNSPLAAQWAVKFFSAFLDDLVETIPALTVNDLRIVCTIIHAEMFDEPVGVSELSEQLNIPKATVSRIVAKLSAGEGFKEAAHVDGRRHPLIHTDTTRELTAQWGEKIAYSAVKTGLECCGSVPEFIKELFEMFPAVTDDQKAQSSTSTPVRP